LKTSKFLIIKNKNTLLLELSRFDLNYLRPLQSDEVHSVTEFLRTSQEEIRRKRMNAKLESSLNQQILKIAIIY
jgi:hypothetical protein